MMMKRLPDIWITFLMAFLLIVMLGFILPKRDDQQPEERFWTRKTFAPPVYDVVIMGDSRAYRGLSPGAMKEHLPGMKILNFGYSNGGLNQEMFREAEKKLARNRSGKVIVLAITANCLTGYSSGNEQWRQERSRPREDIIERLHVQPLISRFAPVRLEKIAIHETAVSTDITYLNIYHPDGWVESDKIPADTLEALPSYIKDFTNFKVEGAAMNALFQQVKKWSSEGIRVVALRPPVSAPMRALEDTMGLYNETVIKNGIEEAGGYWIDIDPSAYQTYDGSHLKKSSALHLSEAIAIKLDSIL